ncbi:hypothetical protein HX805_15855 [Pseudomonas sp. G5001]|uniref:hypothetical protein n=1 Tax=Pseudomonas sp. G5001 TaxID=2738824 RepID=UPI0015A18E2B|nr:hypothetical protein [Pseudomonas sp. G5001]NWB73934.1 hypothetical protein [Pseudomonas sp. G5001]
MNAKILIFLFAACLTSSAIAAKKPSTPTLWAQEPDSFMGLRFDQKVDATVPACPRGTILSKTMCHEPPYTNLYTVRGGPEIGFGYSLAVFASPSGVESFYLTTNSDNFSKLVTLFTNKYGTPTQILNEPVKTKAGASFTNETLTWSGKKVEITIEKLAGDINTSAATISDIAATQRKAAEREAKASSNANKL